MSGPVRVYLSIGSNVDRERYVIAALDALINDTMAVETPDVYQRVIVERNERWIPQIEEILAGEGIVFIAVGAGHLAGESSVITMLRERGHTVVGP